MVLHTKENGLGHHFLKLLMRENLEDEMDPKRVYGPHYLNRDCSSIGVYDPKRFMAHIALIGIMVV